MKFYKRFFGHLKTVNKHRREVRKLCFRCGLYWQGLTHDLSKYSPIEFWNGVKFFTGTCSPHVKEREVNGYSRAWMHHKRKNKHHAEYWFDKKPVEMPEKYLREMLCDRIAASKTYLKNKYTDSAPLQYYLTHQEENQFAPSTKMKLENLLMMLSVEGEDSLFRCLRKNK